MALEQLFSDIDDFCRVFEVVCRQKMLVTSSKKRQRTSTLSLSEVMTIVINFHQSRYRTFKDYYINHVTN